MVYIKKVGGNMTISKMSEKYGLSSDTLRYYERIGLLPHVQRNDSGFRDYGETDGQWVEFIMCMRSAGIPVETLIEYVELFQQGDSTKEARKAILIEQRDNLAERIEEMQATLKRLNFKIEGYEELMLPKERELSED